MPVKARGKGSHSCCPAPALGALGTGGMTDRATERPRRGMLVVGPPKAVTIFNLRSVCHGRQDTGCWCQEKIETIKNKQKHILGKKKVKELAKGK